MPAAGLRYNQPLQRTGRASRSSSFEKWLVPARPLNVGPLYRLSMDSIVTLLTSSDAAHVAEGVLRAVELFEAASASADDHRAVRDALMAVAETEPPHPSAGAAV